MSSDHRRKRKAFFSGTDDRDDTGKVTISGVVGKLSSACEMVFRFNLPGNMKISNLSIGDIFAEEGSSFAVPKEWLSQVKREVRQPYAANYATGGRYGYDKNRAVGRTTAPVTPTTKPSSAGTSLTPEEQEVLASFGFPFALEEEGGGNLLPFSERPLTRGRKKSGKNSKGASISRPSFEKRVSQKMPTK